MWPLPESTVKPWRLPAGALTAAAAVIVFLAGLWGPAPALSQEPAPPAVTDAHDTAPAAPEPFFFRFYSEVISRADGDRCPMSPSCSRYAESAFARHGWIIGWFMTTDRLMRCGYDETHLSPTIRKDGRTLTLDPVEANDFWQ